MSRMERVIHCGDSGCGWDGVEHFHSVQYDPDPLYVDEEPWTLPEPVTPGNDWRIWAIAALLLALLTWRTRR